MNGSRWVDERLAVLDPEPKWRPDAARVLARLHRRERDSHVRRRGWIWAAAAATVSYMALFALPSRGVCAQRLWGGTCAMPAAAPRPVPAQPALSSTYKESGSPSAAITLEIYSDYECPSCARFFNTELPALVSAYVNTGKIRIVHRDFPLAQHPYAPLAAGYANAAGRIGYYDMAVNQLFRTQARWGATGDIKACLSEVFSPANMRKIDSLVASDPQLEEGIAADLKMGLTDRVGQTPTLVIVNRGKRQIVAPIPPLVVLESYLNQLLSLN